MLVVFLFLGRKKVTFFLFFDARLLVRNFYAVFLFFLPDKYARSRRVEKIFPDGRDRMIRC